MMQRSEREEIEKNVLKRLKPKKKEIDKTNKIAKQIIKELKNLGFEAILVGSSARGTFISGDKDIDVFFFFSKETTREELEKKGIGAGMTVLQKYNPIKHYAEHPYVKAKVEGYDVEIVPCYKIKKGNKIISAVDRTPLHNEYILHNLKEGQKEDVLLLKQFLKSFEGYGADAKVKGFSGYLCELLIIAYKDLDKLLKAAAHEWNKKIIIDIEKARESYVKFKEPLVVIDPIDSNRNVAAAVDRTILSKFILRTEEYLVSPSPDFFSIKRKRITKKGLKKLIKGRNLLVVSFKYPKGIIEEIVWSQLERLTRILKNQLLEKEFRVYRSMYWTDESKKCSILFELQSHEIDEYMVHKGPEIWDRENAKAFIKKNENYWIKRSKLYSWRKRVFNSTDSLIKNILNEGELIPSHLKKVTKKHRVRLNEKTLRDKNILRKYFEW